MASQAIGERRRGISVGSVFGRAFAVMKANPVATLGLTFVLVALPQLLLEQLAGRAALAANFREGAYALAIAYGVTIGLLWLVGSGAMVGAALAHDRGQPADLREILQLGVRRALPLLAVNLILVCGVWIGCIFLLAPGIMLAVLWSVSMPAVVAERTGVFGAFGRSRVLTKGARWQVFGIMLLALVIYMLASVAIGVASVAGYGTLGAMTGEVAVTAAPTTSLVVQLLQALVTTVTLTWFTLVGASLFIELRHWKDGPDVERLADIFA